MEREDNIHRGVLGVAVEWKRRMFLEAEGFEEIILSVLKDHPIVVVDGKISAMEALHAVAEEAYVRGTKFSKSKMTFAGKGIIGSCTTLGWKQEPKERVFSDPQDVTRDHLAVFGITEDGRTLQEIGKFTWDDEDEKTTLRTELLEKLNQQRLFPAAVEVK